MKTAQCVAAVAVAVGLALGGAAGVAVAAPGDDQMLGPIPAQPYAGAPMPGPAELARVNDYARTATDLINAEYGPSSKLTVQPAKFYSRSKGKATVTVPAKADRQPVDFTVKLVAVEQGQPWKIVAMTPKL